MSVINKAMLKPSIASQMKSKFYNLMSLSILGSLWPYEVPRASSFLMAIWYPSTHAAQTSQSALWTPGVALWSSFQRNNNNRKTSTLNFHERGGLLSIPLLLCSLGPVYTLAWLWAQLWRKVVKSGTVSYGESHASIENIASGWRWSSWLISFWIYPLNLSEFHWFLVKRHWERQHGCSSKRASLGPWKEDW